MKLPDQPTGADLDTFRDRANKALRAAIMDMVHTSPAVYSMPTFGEQKTLREESLCEAAVSAIEDHIEVRRRFYTPRPVE
jgi:hypothetical protein